MASSRSAAILVTLNILLFSVLASAARPGAEKCPRDALKLSVCADVLGGLVNVKLPADPIKNAECCSLIGDLIKLDAAACLCTKLNVSLLNLINLDLGIDLSLLLRHCKAPEGFQC